MRLLSARYRVFVHATEDEARVRDALLWAMAQLEAPRAADLVERKRVKGHYGNDILILEAALKRAADLEAALGRLRSSEAFRQALGAQLGRFVDEDGALHVRLDKQAAVERRLEMTLGSDAIVVVAKAKTVQGDPVLRAWSRLLGTHPSREGTPHGTPTSL